MGKLNATAEAQIREICDRYKGEKTPLMMILSDIQNEYGYIPLEVQEVVSEKTGISVAEIYGVVTFYSFFSLLGIKPGQTTEDGLFTLDALRCIGACGIAPAVSINGKVYPKVDVEHVEDIIASYRKEVSA